MGSINFRNSFSFLFSLFSFLFVSVLSAEDYGPAGSLVSEIQRLDALIQDADIDDAVQKDALSEKARLLEMTGNIEDAARTWNEASFAEANKRDDYALLRSAVCLAAMAEYDKADAALKMILLTGRDAQSQKDARYLSAQIEVLRDGEQGFPALLTFLENPEYASSRPGIYYLLWKISGSEQYKTKLISDFPESLETRLAREDTSVIPALTPMWFLFPGRDQLVFSDPVTNPSTEIPAPANISPGTEAAPPGQDSPVLIQAGLYSQQENAEAMVERLKAKGFTAAVSPKNVSGTMYWQVTLSPGSDANQTIMILKDAGFESFPVFRDM